MTRLNDLADEIRDLKGHFDDATTTYQRIALDEKLAVLKGDFAVDVARRANGPERVLEAIEYEHDRALRLIEIVRCQSAALRTIHDELDNVYDVETSTNGHQKESPFSGCGELITLIGIALAKADPSWPQETAQLTSSDSFKYVPVEKTAHVG